MVSFSFRLGLLTAVGVSLCTSGCHTFRRQAVEEHVATSREYSLRGMAEFEQGNHTEAKALLAQAVKSFPRDFRARRRYADALFALGDTDGAMVQMEQAVRLSGNEPIQLVRLGEMHLERGNVDFGRKLAEQAIKDDPHLASGWALLARIELLQKNDNAATLAYLRAIDEGEPLENVAIPLAHLYFRDNKNLRAYSLIQRVEGESEDALSRVPYLAGLKGIALKELGRTHEAIPVLLDAIERDPEAHELVVALVDAQLAIGDIDNAKLALSRGFQRIGEHPELNRMASQIDSASRLAARPDSSPPSQQPLTR